MKRHELDFDDELEDELLDMFDPDPAPAQEISLDPIGDLLGRNLPFNMNQQEAHKIDSDVEESEPQVLMCADETDEMECVD